MTCAPFEVPPRGPRPRGVADAGWANHAPETGPNSTPAIARPAEAAAAALRLGGFLNDVVLAFYLLHEPVVVAVASVVLSWRLAAGIQYLLISGASLAVTVALCALVGRNPVTRYLFGLRPRGVPSTP